LLRGALVALALVASAGLPASSADDVPDAAGDPVRGKAIADLASCASCHTADDGVPYAGGHGIVTDFGTFYGTNLTPDVEHGIGDWTFADFQRAMRHGKGPDGTRLWPAFPFTSFQRIDDRDLHDLWAYLRSLPPSPTENRAHETGRGRWQLRFWRALAFRDRGVFEPDPDATAEENRGHYLVDAIGHCGECHTPRGGLGGLKQRRYLGGSDTEPEPGPNLTPSKAGLGDWTLDDWTTFLELGMTPDGDFVGGQMGRVIEEGTSQLSQEDRRAIGVYLMGIEPVGK